MALKFHEVIDGVKNRPREKKEQIKSLADKMITDDIRQEFRETADQARLDYKDGKLEGGSAADVLKLLNGNSIYWKIR